MGDYTANQKFYLCCGYFCALMGCIGVYFFLVLSYWQAKRSTYLIYEMEWLSDPTGENAQEVDNFYTAFLVTALVSISIPANLLTA